MLFKLSNLNSNLALTLGYLNLALNNWPWCTKNSALALIRLRFLLKVFHSIIPWIVLHPVLLPLLICLGYLGFCVHWQCVVKVEQAQAGLGRISMNYLTWLTTWRPNLLSRNGGRRLRFDWICYSSNLSLWPSIFVPTADCPYWQLRGVSGERVFIPFSYIKCMVKEVGEIG